MFTIISPTLSSSIVGSSNFTPSSMQQVGVNYSKQGGKWIYCNFPETYTTSDIVTATGGRVFNKVNISGTKPHQVFFSYQPKTTMTSYFNIQIQNTGTTTITLTVTNKGIRHTADASFANVDPDQLWNKTSGESWRDFFAGTNETITIPAGESRWIVKDYVKPWQAGLITGNVRFSMGNAANTATVYVYMADATGLSGVGKSPVTYDNGKYYSGYSDGYMLAANVTVKASELSSKKCIYLNHPSGIQNMRIGGTSVTSDLLPITLTNGSVISYNTAGQNLGNWGAQYIYTLNLYNDTSVAKTFNVYLRSGVTGSYDYPVIMSGTNFEYARLQAQAWKWLTVTVKPWETETDTFQYILGTNSSDKKEMIFELA